LRGGTFTGDSGWGVISGPPVLHRMESRAGRRRGGRQSIIMIE